MPTKAELTKTLKGMEELVKMQRERIAELQKSLNAWKEQAEKYRQEQPIIISTIEDEWKPVLRSAGKYIEELKEENEELKEENAELKEENERLKEWENKTSDYDYFVEYYDKYNL
jgi:cell division protein FtsB